MRRLLPGAVLLMLVWPAPGHAEGKIERARQEIRKGEDSRTDRERSERDDDEDDGDHDSEDVVNAVLDLLFEALTSDSGEPAESYGYARYPYASGAPGYLVSRTPVLALGPSFADGDLGPRLAFDRPNAWALQLSLQGGYLDGIARTSPGVRLLTPLRVELDTRLGVLLEPSSPSGNDHATLGQTHLGYRIAENEHMMLRLGLGVRYFVDAEGADVGPDIAIGTDAFVARPFVLSLELGFGALGDAYVVSGRAQLGVMLGRVELFAAYDHLQIGDVYLGTPMLGTRLWL